MKNKPIYTPQQECPHCLGTHYGQRFDDCPYVKILSDPNATEEEKANANSFLAATVNTHNLGTCLRFANNESCRGCGDRENGNVLPAPPEAPSE